MENLNRTARYPRSSELPIIPKTGRQNKSDSEVTAHLSLRKPDCQIPHIPNYWAENGSNRNVSVGFEQLHSETDSSSESEDEIDDHAFERDKNRFTSYKNIFTKWITAAAGGNLRALQSMHDEHHNTYDVDVANGTNGKKTALHVASGGGHAKVVKQLLTWGAVVDAQSVKGITPLMLACEGSHAEVVDILLHEFDIDVGVKSAQGETAFHFATRAGSLDILDSLIMKINRPGPLDCSNRLGETPLLLAAAKNEADMVYSLLFFDANVDKINNEGENALHIAAKGGFNDVGSILLRAECSERAAHTPKKGEEWIIKNENSHRKCDELSVEKTNPYPRLIPLEIAINFKRYDFAALLFKEGEAMNYFKEIDSGLKSQLIKQSIDTYRIGLLEAMCFADKEFFKDKRRLFFSSNNDETCDHIRSSVRAMITTDEQGDVDKIKKGIDRECC